ncbi:unnamed protein product [Fraxinus pennsylvanica]|uniref:Uncharacterized protein n=1 Tax=Fraxinus pennsylvanica TaxID=56036 RepID=A0AAD1YPK8_9LAMI|nr:unnamed protein product [Fraxinus pennsylvanica]
MVRLFLIILKLLLIPKSASWVSLRLLKPTKAWTRKWKVAEEKATATMFGYGKSDSEDKLDVAGAVEGFLAIGGWGSSCSESDSEEPISSDEASSSSVPDFDFGIDAGL